MMKLCFDLLCVLEGRTLVTAESCTGGMIGAAITEVPGSSVVYKGGVISYTNQVKRSLLGVPVEFLVDEGAVSESVAKAMAEGARLSMNADVAISTTGLAGPGGDEYGTPVGTVYIGYSDAKHTIARKFLFSGDREAVRRQATQYALMLALEMQK